MGAAHIGVLKTLAEKEVTITHIAGTSIGSLIAALYAFGKTADEIKEIALDLKWMKVSDISISKFALLSNEKPKNILDVLINSFHITLMASARLQTEVADLMIKPDLSDFNYTNTGQVKDLIRQGYKEAKKALKR